ncbi:MAG: protein kinase, partial [Gemmatimonadales bacterium]
PLLIMPYIDGETLADILLREGPLPVETVLTLLNEIGMALAFAHDRDVIHRDIKPSNILLERETNRWLLTDFGVARIVTDSDEALTKSGMAIGTPAYMAPEQFGGADRADARTDLYALAAVGFEALTGFRPDPLATSESLVTTFRSHREDASGDLAVHLASALSHSPSQRPNSVQDWLATINRTTKSGGGKSLLYVAIAALALVAAWQFVAGGGLSFGRSGAATARTVLVFPFAGRDSENLSTFELQSDLHWYLQRLPDVRTISPTVLRARAVADFGDRELTRTEKLSLGAELGATEIIDGRVQLRPRDSVQILVDLVSVADGETVYRRDVTTALDSVSGVVSAIAFEAFGQQLATELTGVTATLPNGFDAYSELRLGERAFRRGAYHEAANHFARVAELDTSYAIAPFKRMLALSQSVRPTDVSQQVTTALEAAAQYSDRLDPAYRLLLDGYQALLVQGDVLGAYRSFERVAQRYPDFVDGWYVLAYVKFWLGALLGISVQEARQSFAYLSNRVGPMAAVEGHLALASLELDDQAAARRHIEHYLAIDSLSDRAELARSIDSLVFRPQLASAVMRSFRTRSDQYLETIALAGTPFDPPGGGRAVAIAAIEELWRRAATPRERIVAFRLLMSFAIASGRYDTARRYLASAIDHGVGREEVDTWVVLSAVEAPAPLLDSDATTAAATRLANPSSEPGTIEHSTALWLAGRALLQSDTDLLDELARSAATHTGRALTLDLRAHESLAEGDTVGALTQLERAMRFYDVEQLVSGTVASLWPSRLLLLQLKHATATAEETINLGRPFVRPVGIVDQVAWPKAIPIIAQAQYRSGRPDNAQELFRGLNRVVASAEAEGRLMRDRVVAQFDSLLNNRNRNP